MRFPGRRDETLANVESSRHVRSSAVSGPRDVLRGIFSETNQGDRQLPTSAARLSKLLRLLLVSDLTAERFAISRMTFHRGESFFRYIPPSMRDKEETEDWWQQLYVVTTTIKKCLTLKGSLLIGYTPLPHKNIGNFFRMVVTCQPPPTESSMDYVIRQIEESAADL